MHPTRLTIGSGKKSWVCEYPSPSGGGRLAYQGNILADSETDARILFENWWPRYFNCPLLKEARVIEGRLKLILVTADGEKEVTRD